MTGQDSNRRLVVKDLSIRFGGVVALKDVSFSVEPGRFVGLMGANGAGKTTLINCISRVLMGSTGEVTFGDHRLSELGAHDVFRLGISRTFQDLGFFSRISEMRVLDYMKLGCF